MSVRAQLLARHLDGWALLLVPFAIGVIRSHGDRDHVAMALAWLLACLTYRAWCGPGTGPVAVSATPQGGRNAVAKDAAPVEQRQQPEQAEPDAGAGRVSRWRGVLTGLTVVVVVATVAHRPDLIVWLPGPVVAAVAAVWLHRRGRGASRTGEVLAALAAAVVGLCVYQGGYPSGGTIVVGWTAVTALQAAAFAAICGMILTRMARHRRLPVAVPLAWHLFIAALALAIARWPGHPPGLWGRGLVLLAICFVALTARSLVVAKTRLPAPLVGGVDLIAWIALIVLAARWP